MPFQPGVPSGRQTANYYELLGVPEGAGFRDIQAAYWRLAMSPAARAQLTALNEAFETLSNTPRREAYDEQRRASQLGQRDPWSPPAPSNPGVQHKLRFVR